MEGEGPVDGGDEREQGRGGGRAAAGLERDERAAAVVVDEGREAVQADLMRGEGGPRKPR